MRAALALSLVFIACATGSSISAPTPDAPVVCKYSLNPMYLSPASLRLRPTGATFATTKWSPRAGVDFKLPFGPPAQGAQLTFTSRWVTMKVIYVAEQGFELSLLSPWHLSPVLTAPRGARVTWQGSAGNRVIVGLRRPENFENQTTSTLELPCNQTSIAAIELAGGDDALYEPDAGLREFTLDAGARLPVSVTPGGPPMEVLTGVDALGVIDETPDALHVHEWFGELVLDGWVPRAPMQPSERDGLANVFGIGGLGQGDARKDLPRCATDVPLMLRFEGQLHVLGTVRKGAAWKELRREGAWVDIALPEFDWLTLTPGAAFVLSSESATACKG